jgi:hypothetical protein
MCTPIKKEEVKKIKKISLDPVMVKAVNNLIVKNYDGKIAKFNQQELIDEYYTIGGALSTVELFDKRQLDIESIFIDIGWDVKYKDLLGEDSKGFWEFK